MDNASLGRNLSSNTGHSGDNFIIPASFGGTLAYNGVQQGEEITESTPFWKGMVPQRSLRKG